MELAIDPRFTEDFLTYWGLLSFLIGATGRTMGAEFDRHRMDGLSRGLRATYVANWRRTPGVLRRLRRTRRRTRRRSGDWTSSCPRSWPTPARRWATSTRPFRTPR